MSALYHTFPMPILFYLHFSNVSQRPSKNSLLKICFQTRNAEEVITPDGDAGCDRDVYANATSDVLLNGVAKKPEGDNDVLARRYINLMSHNAMIYLNGTIPVLGLDCCLRALRLSLRFQCSCLQ